MSEEKQELVVKTEDEQAFELVQREATALSKSQLVPKQFQNNVPDCMIAIEMAKRIGAAPLAVLQNIYIVHGKPSWSSQFIIAMINQCGRFHPIKFHNNGSEAYCYTTYKDNEEEIKGPVVNIEMAKKEGWLQKNGSKWQTMPELMLNYRAATFFGRMYCPDLLMGMQSIEEISDIQANKEAQKPTFKTKEQLDEEFNLEQ